MFNCLTNCCMNTYYCLSNCFIKTCYCLTNCFMKICYCCQCNCIIFPAPQYNNGWDYKTIVTKDQIQIKLNWFVNKSDQKVPYISLQSESSLNKKQIIVYFHGNAQDIFHSSDFLLPIFKATQTTILCMQYPTYSCYQSEFSFFISNKIKANCVQFASYVQKQHKISPYNTYVIGRSIGSGPATYLASTIKCQKLILISPFDSIQKVAEGHVKCSGNIVKNHFDNLEKIKNYPGKLLVIHGKIDEVINFSHGANLVTCYQTTHNKKCTFIQPSRMSHNNFDMNQDIINPIKQFLSSNNNNKNNHRDLEDNIVYD